MRPQPPNDEERIRRQFDCLCKKVLRNEARNCYRDLKRRRQNEVPLAGLSGADRRRLSRMDDYFAEEGLFEVPGGKVLVQDGRIARALRGHPAQRRTIVLLYYYLDLSDRQIAELLHLKRRTVSRYRTRSIEELKAKLEEDTDE